MKAYFNYPLKHYKATLSYNCGKNTTTKQFISKYKHEALIVKKYIFK